MSDGEYVGIFRGYPVEITAEGGGDSSVETLLVMDTTYPEEREPHHWHFGRKDVELLREAGHLESLTPPAPPITVSLPYHTRLTERLEDFKVK